MVNISTWPLAVPSLLSTQWSGSDNFLISVWLPQTSLGYQIFPVRTQKYYLFHVKLESLNFTFAPYFCFTSHKFWLYLLLLFLLLSFPLKLTSSGFEPYHSSEIILCIARKQWLTCQQHLKQVIVLFFLESFFFQAFGTPSFLIFLFPFWLVLLSFLCSTLLNSPFLNVGGTFRLSLWKPHFYL